MDPAIEPKNRNFEIDLLALMKIIWEQRYVLVKIIALFMILGLGIALITPKEFTSTASFIPQSSEGARGGGLGNLSGLASIAGISLGAGNQNSEVSPMIYPKVVTGVEFQSKLINTEILPESGSPISYAAFYEREGKTGASAFIRKYTIELVTTILSSKQSVDVDDSLMVEIDDGLFRVTRQQSNHFKRLAKQLSVNLNEKDGLVELSFTMPEPLMAAQMANQALKNLQEEVIAFKIKNAEEQLNFTENRFEEKKAEFEQIQRKLAAFRDRNQNISSAMALNEEQKLEAEYNFSFNVYTELAKQLEQARFQVSKDTPVFSIINPVSVPSEKSAPKRGMIVIVFTFLGVVISVGYVIGKAFFNRTI